MTLSPREITARDVTDPAAFLSEIAEPCRPVVIRGLVGSWPAVSAGARSPTELRDYLSRFDAGGEAEVFVGDSHIAGKYYYSDDLRGFNFARARMHFSDTLDRIVATAANPNGTSMYMGSLPVEDYLPGFTAENPLSVLKTNVAPRIWLGHA